MWKNLRNCVSAARDIVAIGTKEVSYQASRASEATATVTGSISSKAAALRTRYEAELADRKAGVKKAEVVKDVPADVITIK